MRLPHGTKSYRLPSGILVALNWTELVSGTVLHAVDEDENGHLLAGLVWTGTSAAGAAITPRCTEWTSTSANGKVGDTTSVSAWSATGDQLCAAQHHLYCVED
jgi:hypothetical protein